MGLGFTTVHPCTSRTSPAYYVCTTKVDFPATEAPGVRGVLHLYYKSRLSSHGRSTTEEDFENPKERTGPRQYYFCCTKDVFSHKENTTVLAPRPRENPQRGCVCVSKNAKTRRFWHRDHGDPRRGLTRPRKHVQKTMVLAPRPRRNPRRVVRAKQETLKNYDFSTATTPKPAEGCPRTARNIKKRWF